MKFTQEQYEIINSTGDIKINAVAGSGKTSTVLAYAAARPSSSRILYLVFNRSVKMEAAQKIAAMGLSNVKVETAHSLAFRHIVLQHGYKVRPQDYKTNELVEILQLQGNGEKHTEYIVANHVNKFLAYFCNSDKEKVQHLDYLETISDAKARVFVKSFYPYIEQQARRLLAMMDAGEIEVTHDFYLKKFQLSNPVLNYDFILFDEAQDASPAMMDVFLKQKAVKVVVGDTHQQIYSWRYAVNTLEKVNFSTYHLSQSFRFGEDVARLAMESLNLKKYLGDFEDLKISGSGKHESNETKAVLGRTNLGLLKLAIEYVTEKQKVKLLYFEGNFNSYTYADEGASLYDVLNLHNGKRNLIKDSLIKAMKDLEELEDYIDKTGDVSLGMMLEIVKRYGNEIPGIIKKIKALHVPNDEKKNAEIIFSTVHRCKGMEYDCIQLADDFITSEKLEEFVKEKKKEEAYTTKGKLVEEINLLYVAITRARSTIHIPEKLLPAGFAASSHIKIIKPPQEVARYGVTYAPPTEQYSLPGNKTWTLEEKRRKHAGAYKPWSAELDKELTELYQQKNSTKVLASHFGRTQGAINSRIKKLEL